MVILARRLIHSYRPVTRSYQLGAAAVIFRQIYVIVTPLLPCNKQVGLVDAVISTAGNVHFGPLVEFTQEQFMIGLIDKVMGQINLVLEGLNYINDNGSFTLTSGVLDRDPIALGAGAATANGAIGGFVVGAAIEMPRGLRINVISPGLLDVSERRYGSYFPGHERVSSQRVGLAYSKSVEGFATGKVIIVD